MIEPNPNILRAQLAGKPTIMTYLIRLDFGDETFYLTDAPGDIDQGDNVYRADGNVAAVELPKQGKNLDRAICTLALNQVPNYPVWGSLINRYPLSTRIDISVHVREDENDPGQVVPAYKGRSVRSSQSDGVVEIKFGGPFSQIDGEHAFTTSRSNQATRDATDTWFDDIGITEQDVEWGVVKPENLRFTHALVFDATTYFQVERYQLSYDLANIVTGGKEPYTFRPSQVITKTYLNTKHNIGPSVVTDTINISIQDADGVSISGTLRIRVNFSGQPYHGLLGETPFRLNKLALLDGTYYTNRAGQDNLYTINPANPNEVRLLGPAFHAGTPISIMNDETITQRSLLILDSIGGFNRVDPDNPRNAENPFGSFGSSLFRDSADNTFVRYRAAQFVNGVLYGISYTAIPNDPAILYRVNLSNTNAQVKVGELPDIFRGINDLESIGSSLYATVRGDINLYRINTSDATVTPDTELPVGLITGIAEFQNGLLLGQSEPASLGGRERLWSTEVL